MSLKSFELAINGGTPVRTKPWLDNFTTGEEEIAAVAEVIKSGYLSLFEGSHTPDAPFRFDGGKWCRGLEEAVCEKFGAKHGISNNSATSGLYMAIGALGIGYGDEVIVSPYTMSACATAPLVYGAIPVFADVDENTGALDPESIKKNITPRTKAILVVHQFGIPADMAAIMKLAKDHGLKVIEDCAQAWGAKVGNKFVGTIGDIGVFSFNVNKTIQSGEGGLCVTNDDDLAYRLKLIRNHGEAVVGPAGYDNITNIIGYNYRMTDVTAAIALEQFKKLPDLNEKRLEMVVKLQDGLDKYDFFTPLKPKQGDVATYYVTPCRYLPQNNGNIKREDFLAAVNAEGICFYQGYTKPLYLQPIYQNKQAFKNGYPWAAPENKNSKPNYDLGACPVAERLHFKEMVINEHIRMPNTLDDVDDILKALNKVAKCV